MAYKINDFKPSHLSLPTCIIFPSQNHQLPKTLFCDNICIILCTFYFLNERAYFVNKHQPKMSHLMA